MHKILMDFFPPQMDYLFFLHGLFLMLTGCMCLLMRDAQKYRVKWNYFGLFCILQGVYVWHSLYMVSFGALTSVCLLQQGIGIGSWLCLVEFCRRNTRSGFGGRRGTVLYGLSVLALVVGWGLGGAPGLEAMARYGLLAGGGLWAAVVMYQRAVRQEKIPFILCWMAVVTGIYALLAGCIVPQADFFPANVLTQQRLFDFSGIPLPALEALLSAGLLFLTCTYFIEETLADKRRDLKARHHFYTWLLCGLMIALLSSGWVYTQKVSDGNRDAFNKELLVRVRTLAAGLNHLQVKKLSGSSTDVDLVEFQALKKHLKQARDVSKDCRFIYLMKIINGKAVFLIDAEAPTSKDYSFPGQVFEEVDQELFDALSTGRAYVAPPMKDRWGEWISGIAPIYDDDQHLLASLGMDISADLYRKNIAIDRLATMLIILLGNVLLWALFIIMVSIEERALRMKESKEASDAANKAKTEFLANMSHEIRTPMNAVLGFADVLKDAKLSPLHSYYLDSLYTSGQQLMGLINDILDISKIEAGQLTLEQIDFNLAYLVEDVLKMARGRVQTEGLQLLYNFASDLEADFQGDPTKIRQILINLLGNSIKFTKAGSVALDVRLEQDRGHEVVVYFSITDTGIGIPSDKISMVFEKFVQVNASTTREYGGTGLGLAICRLLVEAMGGSIAVKSEPGKGSCFYFSIVLKKAVGKALDKVQPLFLNEIEGHPILIIDDSPVPVDVLSRACSEFKLNVFRSASCAQALDWLAQRDRERQTLPEVVLFHIQSPLTDGQQLIKTLRQTKSFANIKFVAVTMDSYSGVCAKYQEAGFNAYLPKPVIVRELQSLLLTVFGDRRAGSGIILTRHTAGELACKGVHCLVVEDFVTNRDVIKAFSNILGNTVDFAENGLQALEMLTKDHSQYAMCFMDLHMPGMDGLEATQIIRREISRDLPIIALTADAMTGDRARCLEAGMNDFLSKPVTRLSFRDKVLKYARARLT
ncbi:MAG: response regulator [Candidatus Omnitrophica bacterium]|nr:response regulator [Candidatus Omnitrophota bacterium]